ncbi:DUF2066 domain-containing protein [Haliea atlantica]
MPHRLLLLLCWLLLAASLPLRAAEQVQDLYASAVAVADRGAPALEEAARQALEEVLIKTSGSDSALAAPAVEAALQRARELMLQYSYVRLDGGDGLAARIEFDPPQIRALLAEAGAPLWTANRPTVLIWLVEETPDGRRFVTRENNPALAEALIRGFQRRGVPARFPLLDLADTAALPADMAWQLPASRLQSAAARYGVNDLLAGRLATVSAGDYLGDLVYLSSAGRVGRAVSPGSPEALAAAGVDLVVEALAARYAVAASSAAADAVLLEVSGVQSYADYAALLNWIEGLELVARVDVTAVAGEQLELRLHSGASVESLADILGLNANLVAAAAPEPGRLSYRWRR